MVLCYSVNNLSLCLLQFSNNLQQANTGDLIYVDVQPFQETTRIWEMRVKRTMAPHNWTMKLMIRAYYGALMPIN